MTAAHPRSSWLIERCRLCDSGALEFVLALTPTPPANGLLRRDQLDDPIESFPLEMMRCATCGHLQLHHAVNPEILFSDYLYVSGTSPVMAAHLSKQAETIDTRVGGKTKSIIEIGSNDGSLLRCFKSMGYRIQGIDPARNIAERAIADGIPTEIAFFTEDVGRSLAEQHGRFSVACANHCFAHIADLNSVVEGVKHVLTEDGEFVFEVGYLLDVYSNTLFDTIYHEHLDYHHVEPLTQFFSRHGMTLVHVERHNIQGGALRGFARIGVHQPDSSVAALVVLEKNAGLDRLETFQDFEKAIAKRRDEFSSLLDGLVQRGASIAGFGMPAKATTLMHHFGLDHSIIEYVVDDNPLKQGLFGPGTQVPILGMEELYNRRPDYVVILAWNFAESIVEAHKEYRSGGGRFVVPLPDLRIW